GLRQVGEDVGGLTEHGRVAAARPGGVGGRDSGGGGPGERRAPGKSEHGSPSRPGPSVQGTALFLSERERLLGGLALLLAALGFLGLDVVPEIERRLFALGHGLTPQRKLTASCQLINPLSAYRR